MMKSTSASHPEFLPRRPVDSKPFPPRRSIASDLERSRLEHRARRLDATLRALRDRVSDHQERGHVPQPLTEAIADFRSELARVRARLDGLVAREVTG
jgi:hypothetical protein